MDFNTSSPRAHRRAHPSTRPGSVYPRAGWPGYQYVRPGQPQPAHRNVHQVSVHPRFRQPGVQYVRPGQPQPAHQQAPVQQAPVFQQQAPVQQASVFQQQAPVFEQQAPVWVQQQPAPQQMTTLQQQPATQQPNSGRPTQDWSDEDSLPEVILPGSDLPPQKVLGLVRLSPGRWYLLHRRYNSFAAGLAALDYECLLYTWSIPITKSVLEIITELKIKMPVLKIRSPRQTLVAGHGWFSDAAADTAIVTALNHIINK